jgi:hypothetical protein
MRFFVEKNKKFRKMKNYIFLLFVAIAFCFCNKNVAIIDPIDTNPIPIDTVVVIDTTHHVIEFGKSSMIKNGVLFTTPFKAGFFGNTKNKFYISCRFLNQNSLTGSVGFLDIGCKLGKYPIENSMIGDLDNYIPNGLIGYMFEGDQPAGTFLPDTTRNDHYIEILRYDSLTQIVEGTFQVFMGKQPTNHDYVGLPDSIFITEGKFHLKIKEQ